MEQILVDELHTQLNAGLLRVPTHKREAFILHYMKALPTAVYHSYKQWENNQEADRIYGKAES